ncbi:GNAT family N-acetyltransferase [Lottiidibacillus patelloidae]|uniref:GNAT family N-acetyltransferase n=1 Tax=Lottiidibacillus patelloidae TaxID=2670334 RepID=A0A263BXB2_9BACI|nr:GNAT family protein [Lottiidibacillus patelloidae]OZM58218.1 GNAT family N-acetyltransferase [Lottiidibacillus patelloidae]
MYTYIEFTKEMALELIDFLTSETWSFHGQENPTEESIRRNLENGFYTEKGNRTFWITNNDKKIGLIRLFDLEDPTCLFDIRLKEKWRGKGIGKEAVNWLTNFVFSTYPEMIRIEGHTRVDNYAMRKTFFKSGYVKEAYHRQSWRQRGNLYDSVGYAMIREDWENKTKTSINDDFPY